MTGLPSTPSGLTCREKTYGAVTGMVVVLGCTVVGAVVVGAVVGAGGAAVVVIGIVGVGAVVLVGGLVIVGVAAGVAVVVEGSVVVVGVAFAVVAGAVVVLALARRLVVCPDSKSITASSCSTWLTRIWMDATAIHT